MKLLGKLKDIPTEQKFRYLIIITSCLLFFAPFALIPAAVGNDDLCGKMCMRRFFLYFPEMSLDDFITGMTVAWLGVLLLAGIFISTFFYGRLWCSYICPVGGFPEIISRTLNDRWKIEYRSLPQVPIRYGYFAVYVLLMPTLGISACTLCNFITVPRLFEAFSSSISGGVSGNTSGNIRGFVFIFSSIGLVNIALLFLLGFFASKGRAYCQFLCPIGAMDALVNRLGAPLRFTRRIRVERNRCTGCNICARNCMTGAIKMVDRIAVVDQLSCMSCHECVDVCDWHAIDWLALPPDNQPKRKKKGVDFHPLPEWEAVHTEKPETRGLKSINWQRVFLSVLLGMSLLFIIATQVHAKQREPDPDGCLSCHALAGLEYIDDHGILRNASIDQKHYLGSLHGSIPCTDCHRNIKDFPHKVENAEVDCAESCHLEEPSEGEAYTHKTAADSFHKSAHGDGKSSGFTAGNRRLESEEQQNPSCRLCHQNSLYIDPEKIPEFKTAFAHTETECGSCHQGKTWLNRFGGHILRRFLKVQQNEAEQNRICEHCHGDIERMKKIEIEDSQTGTKHPATSRFVLASKSYAMTLHGRLLAAGNMDGVTCIDCHAPGNNKHAILRHKDINASTHKNNLHLTCSASGCHQFSKNHINSGFTRIDMHDIDYIPLYDPVFAASFSPDSPWRVFIAVTAPIIIILIAGSLIWNFFTKKKKSIVFSIIGGNHFQKHMIGRTPKSKIQKRPLKANIKKKPEAGE